MAERETKKKVVPKITEIEEAEVIKVSDIAQQDIQDLHNVCLTITGRIDRIVDAISKSKSIKGM